MERSREFVSLHSGASPREVKTFCKVVSQAAHDELLSRQQARTLMGQAKSGKLKEAKKGMQTIMSR